jgi:hypothetical protein
VGLEFVEEAVTALGSSTELATHLFRECWAVGTGSDTDLCWVFGWELEAHKFRRTTDRPKAARGPTADRQRGARSHPKNEF